MPTLSRNRIRLACDAYKFDAPMDDRRRSTPQIWRGTDFQIEIGIFDNGVLQSVSNVASLSVEIRPATNGQAPEPSVTPVMAHTFTGLDDTVTAETWADGSKQHMLAPFNKNQSNVAPGNYWICIFATTTHDPARLITIAAGPFRVLEDGGGPAAGPMDPEDQFYSAQYIDGNFYTMAAADARFLRRQEALADLDPDDKAPARGNLGVAPSAQDLGDISADEVVTLALAETDVRRAVALFSTNHTINQALVLSHDNATAGAVIVVSGSFETAGAVSFEIHDEEEGGTVLDEFGADQAGEYFGLFVFVGDTWKRLGSLPFSAAVWDILRASTTATDVLHLIAAAPLASPALTGTPTAPTASGGTNTTQLATTAFVQAAIAALVASSPAALDTLNELAAALGNDANFATTVTNALALKAPLASPALTGTPTAPTAAVTVNSTQIATTAWLRDFLASAQRTTLPTSTSFWTLTKSLSGAESIAPFGLRISTGTSEGYCRWFANTGNAPISRGSNMEIINFSKATSFSTKLLAVTTNADATFRLTLGKQSGDGHGALTRKGFGVLIQNTTLKVIAHNGTSQTVGSTGYTMTAGQTIAVRIVSDGAGGVSLYVNETLIETISGGPTGNSSSQAGFMWETDNNASANACSGTIGHVDLQHAA